MRRRTVTSTMAGAFLGGLGLILAPSPATHAGDEWCMSDPALPIRTPGGHTVIVFLNNYALGTQHRPALAQATHHYVARPAEGGAATAVELSVLIPADAPDAGSEARPPRTHGGDGRGSAPTDTSDARFPVRSVVTSRPHAGGDVLAAASGLSGEALVLRFTLPVP